MVRKHAVGSPRSNPWTKAFMNAATQVPEQIFRSRLAPREKHHRAKSLGPFQPSNDWCHCDRLSTRAKAHKNIPRAVGIRCKTGSHPTLRGEFSVDTIRSSCHGDNQCATVFTAMRSNGK